KWHDSDQAFAEMFVNRLESYLEFELPDFLPFIIKERLLVKDMDSLSKFITKLIRKLNKKIVLLIDEVDASSNFDPFLSFLGMLRNKYLDRFSPQNATFHSIVLAGVHDIKTLKHKIRDTLESQYNSPWNIASDFNVQMSFDSSEIAPMLDEYERVEGVEMDIPKISERLYYYTSGYPFLVSKLGKTIAEDILPKKQIKSWDLEDVEEAVKLLLKENNTNFDSLIKNLENNEDLYDLVYQIIIEGSTIPFNQHNPIIHIGTLYGLFKNNGNVKTHNRIYEQLIYNYMTSKALTYIKSGYLYGGHFLEEDNSLNIKAALLKFQQFMKEENSNRNKSFLEENGRLIFLAFLAPILNGQGYTFKEVQTSLEKRLDVVVTYFQHRYIIELKRWYGPKAHEKGLDQLAEYLDFHNLSEGFLVIFDQRKERTWGNEDIIHKGKEIFAVWI
ncbi:MAG: AAA family ATPase, partial [Bacteroidetes bacterium]|nr:AAA family ATPase [Bacteroidota bacterium]